MQISGNTLPVLFRPADLTADQQSPERGTAQLDQNPDAFRQNRQQAVEYVLRGEFVDDEVAFDQQNRNRYAQVIDPANERAIDTYVANEGVTPLQEPRQGRLVDLFI
jgi:hypothetical protein